MATTAATRVNKPPNGARADELHAIDESSIGYRARVTVEGTNMLLLDRYNADVIAAKAALPKGHAKKKEVDHESQVYRHPETGNIAIPGAAFLRSIEEAARYLPPIPGRLERSPAPLIVALVNLAPEDELVDIGLRSWDLIDGKRITLSRGADTMLRPAILAGWRASFSLDVVMGGLITPAILRSAIDVAGRAKGVGAYRRVHGRYMPIAFDYEWVDA